MPPQDPPRRGWPPPVTEVNADPARTHTPIPSLEATTEPPPAPMRKPPPKGYEGPRQRLDSHRDDPTLIGLAPPAERRPEPANPPPPESMRPRVEVSADDFGQTVHANYGKNRFSGPAWVFLVVAALGAAVAITYFVTRNADSSRPPSDTVLNELRAFREEQHGVNIDVKLQLGLLRNDVNSLQSQTGANSAAIGGLSAANPRYAPPSDPRAAPMNDVLKR